MWNRLKLWWRKSRRWSRARRELDEMFTRRADLLATTSLRLEHRSRTQVLDVLDSPRRIYFGIVRHPRPYKFSLQHHRVLELWCLHVEEERLERLQGHNLTREAFSDGDPPSAGV